MPLLSAYDRTDATRFAFSNEQPAFVNISLNKVSSLDFVMRIEVDDERPDRTAWVDSLFLLSYKGVDTIIREDIIGRLRYPLMCLIMISYK